MTTMNDAEREAFEHCWAVRSADDEGNLGAKPLRSEADQQRYRGSAAQGSWVWFQRGAAWQRAQGAVPDVSAMARVLSDRSADACNIDRDDNWAMYGQEYIEDAQAMLAAAPAHPAERQEPVAWLIDWPDEPELGYYFSDEQNEHARSRPLYTTPPTVQGDEVQRLREASEAIRKFEKSGWHGSRGYHAGLLKAAQIVDGLSASTGQEVGE